MMWTTKPLAKLADFCLGKMLDQKKNRGELLPYLANVNVRWGEFDLDNLREMRFEYHEMDRYGLQYGDVVMCEGGEPGRCALWKDPVPGMMIQKALHRIRAHDCLDHRFLYYSFLCLGRRGVFAALLTGATIKHLPREKLALVEISFPSLEDQQRIANVLSFYDDLICNNRRRIQLLEQSARLLFKEWFVHLRFPGHEHARITNGVPERWERKKLGDVLTLKRGYDLPDADRIHGDIPIVSSSGITGCHNAKKANAPGVVTGRYGTLGEVYFVDRDYWPLNTALYVSDFKDNSAVFIAHLLRHVLQGIQSDKAAVPGLNRNVAHALTVLWPSKALRDQFNDYAQVSFRQISVLTAMNERLRAARDLLLPRLMSGEIEV